MDTLKRQVRDENAYNAVLTHLSQSEKAQYGVRLGDLNHIIPRNAGSKRILKQMIAEGLLEGRSGAYFIGEKGTQFLARGQKDAVVFEEPLAAAPEPKGSWVERTQQHQANAAMYDYLKNLPELAQADNTRLAEISDALSALALPKKGRE